MRKDRFLLIALVALALLTALLAVPLTAQEAQVERRAFRPNNKFVGSWFGRAVPIDPWCTPGTPECPVPPEVIMTPTLFADGTMLGMDSLAFGALHSTATGEWKATGPRSMKATMVWLQGDPVAGFVGGVRTRYTAERIGGNRLEGYVNVFLFPFVDETGAAVLDPETGFPIPDPLMPLGDFITDPADCHPALNGCLAVLEFVVRRVTVNLDG